MKPLQLTLKGINSYRKEQTIDFEALTSAGLFGIFGPTGSGKSSILDAITLALYARLPRSTKNFIHINEQSAFVSFRFSITTTATRVYQVERTFRYHQSGSTTTVRNTAGTLAELSGDNTTVLADRPTEVTQECIRLLGLSADDFMRTVVLPQGQFSEFLKLKNAERRGMLQRIFHLEEYGLELTQKIASARQKQELLLSNLEGQLQIYEALTADIMAETERKQKETAEAMTVLFQKKEQQEKEFREIDALRTLWLEYEPVKMAYDAAIKKLPEVEEQKQALSLCQKASRLRPFAEQLKQAEAEKTKAEKQYAEALSRQKQAALLFEQADRARTDFLLTYEKNYPASKEKEQVFTAAMERSTSIAQWNRHSSQLQARLHGEQTTLKELHEKKNALTRQQATLKNNLLSMEQELENVQIPPEKMRALEQGHLTENNYREKKEQYDRAKTLFSTQQNQFQTLKEQMQRQQDALSILAMELTDHQRYFHEKISAGQKQAEQLQKRQLLEKQKLEQLQGQHMALLLREKLTEGVPCPVCGNEHPHYSSASKPVHLEEIHQCRQTLEELENNLEAVRKDMALCEQVLALLEQGFQAAASCLPEHMLSQSESTGQTSGLNPSFESEKELVSAIQKQASEYDRAHGQFAQLATQLKQQQAALKEQHQLLQKEAQDIMALRKDWNIENFTESRAEAKKLSQRAGQLQKEMKQLRQQAEQLAGQQETLSGQILEHSNLISSLESENRQYLLLIKQETEKFPEGLHPQMNYPALLEEIHLTLSNLENQKKERETQAAKQLEQLQKTRETVSAAQAHLLSCEKGTAQAETAFQEQFRLSGLPSDFSLENAYRTPEELARLESEIQRFQDALASTKNHLQYLEGKRQNRTFSPAVWEENKKILEQLCEEYDAREKQHTLLSQTLSTQKEQWKEKQALEQRLKQAVHRRSVIRELEQLFKGNSFIEYVAKSRLDYIAAEASHILSVISSGSYALETNELSEFVIRDNKNGGILRPCDTLSGGETFLTSLALALALSSVIQLNGTAPLELFFLDEGFGSLDEDLLNVVMESLEKLHSSNRSIGIISHVEAIWSRVPVKLVVTPSDISQNGSSIRTEYS